MPKRRAIVVGAGVGGVASAARLSSAGFDVTVVERNSFTGGRCSLIETSDGHRFDQGPSLLLLPRLFEDTFDDLETSLDAEGIELVKCEPNYSIYFGDGEKIDLSTDQAELKREIERFEGTDGFEGYLGFLREAHRHYELSVEHVLSKNFTSLASLLRPEFLSRLFTLHPFTSICLLSTRGLANTSGPSDYGALLRLHPCGMSPFDAPGTYSLLQYTELAEGIWYPLGGFHKIVEGLVKLAEKRGTTIKLETPVKQVIVENGVARGVLLESGERLESDVVVVNADLIYSMNNLFEPTAYAKRLANKPVSCSSISFYWSMDRVVEELNVHNIFLADEYKESFDAIFKEKKMPREPSFYVNVPSRVDPSAAPEDKDSIVVLVPVGHMSEKMPSTSDWKLLVDKARSHVLQVLADRLGLDDFKSWITNEIVNDPMTWREKFNLHKGSILGLSHSFFNVLSFRPATRHPNVKNAYFVGASTHPGTGVPICLAGAKLTTEQILLDQQMPIPWRRVAIDVEYKALDVRKKTLVEQVVGWTLFVLFCSSMFILLPASHIISKGWRTEL